MIDIINKYDDLLDMLDWYNKQKNIMKPVELNIDSNKISWRDKNNNFKIV